MFGSRYPTLLSFGAFIVAALAAVFILGHLTGRWAASLDAQFASDYPTAHQRREFREYLIREVQHVRQIEYVALRKTVELHRERAPIEQRAAIEGCLYVIGECREESAKQRPTAERIADGR